MPMNIRPVLEELGAEPLFELDCLDWEPDWLNTDSRSVIPGQIFIPLRGESHDGHHFIAQAQAQGARFSLCEWQWWSQASEAERALPLIRVADTRQAYQALSRQWRRHWGKTVIGVTGSSGKTSTKELLAAVLSPFYRVHKNQANFNNEIGVPLTLLQLRPEHEICITEMGMRGLGQIQELAAVAEPNFGILTQIGTAHLSELGSRENIARAKWELGVWLEQHGGLLLGQAEDRWQRRMLATTPQLAVRWCGETADSLIRLLEIQERPGGQWLRYQKASGSVHTLELALPGRHQVSNLLLCLGLLECLGHTLPEGFRVEPEQLSGRHQNLQLPKGITLWNDAYNANPESMRAALLTLPGLSGRRKIAVLGKMAELGPDSASFHRELGQFCRELPLDLLLVIGEEARPLLEGFQPADVPALWEPDNRSAAKTLKSLLQPEDTVLFKASRSARLEEVIADLQVGTETESA